MGRTARRANSQGLAGPAQSAQKPQAGQTGSIPHAASLPLRQKSAQKQSQSASNGGKGCGQHDACAGQSRKPGRTVEIFRRRKTGERGSTEQPCPLRGHGGGLFRRWSCCLVRLLRHAPFPHRRLMLPGQIEIDCRPPAPAQGLRAAAKSSITLQGRSRFKLLARTLIRKPTSRRAADCPAPP